MIDKLRMPGAELDGLVAERMSDYDRWEQEQRSAGCQDRDGNKLSKPPDLPANVATLPGKAGERWFGVWSEKLLAHNKKCVRCGGKPCETTSSRSAAE